MKYVKDVTCGRKIDITITFTAQNYIHIATSSQSTFGESAVYFLQTNVENPRFKILGIACFDGTLQDDTFVYKVVLTSLHGKK